MLSHGKYKNCNFNRVEKIEILSRHPNVKKNCSEYNLSEKIYNAIFYSVLKYIHKLHMLSHVKYKNCIFKRIVINLNIIYAPEC